MQVKVLEVRAGGSQLLIELKDSLFRVIAGDEILDELVPEDELECALSTYNECRAGSDATAVSYADLAQASSS